MKLIKKKKKEYNEANKDKISEQQKEYYKANKDKLQEQMKKYNEANKDKLQEKITEKITCNVCGSIICKGALARHKRSIKHQEYIKTIQIPI